MNPNDPVRVYREARANAGTSSLLDVDPDTLHLWRRARSLEAVSRVNPRVPESRSEEYRGIRSALRRILHRGAWQAHPLNVGDEDGDDNGHDASGAREIRRQLDAAIAV